MDYRNVKYILDENKQLKTEVERLRAALTEITTLQTVYQARDMRQIATDALNGMASQQSKVPQTSLRVRLLEALPQPKEKGIDHALIADKTGLDRRTIRNELSNLLIESLVTINNWGGWKLTVKGRDYLNSIGE